jgi:ABC-2 type transport system ATP-binding protein
MIEAAGLTKSYGSTVAVNDLSFVVCPGVVTGFLGPNGAGKTTTMRLILGLDHPSAGTVTVDGRPYAKLANPMREVGALLDPRAVHGGRSARSYLLSLAQTNDIPRRRVEEVLGVVGLTDVAAKRSGAFSLGMSQRLGIAAALLGDPRILMFDEPVNGLDPEGIVWIRTLLRSLAAEGRTVLVSSHLMSEMENTADHLIVIGRGTLIADCPMADFIAHSPDQAVVVRTPQPEAFAAAVRSAGATVTPGDSDSGGQLEVRGLTEDQVADIAFASGIRLQHLAKSRVSLEQAFMELTADSVDYRAQVTGRQPANNGTEA